MLILSQPKRYRSRIVVVLSFFGPISRGIDSGDRLMQRVKLVVVISIFFLVALTTKTVAQQVSDDKLKSRAELTN